MNIFVFGDSITYGLCDEKCGGWVNRLRLYLDNKTDFDHEVFNCGISGDITAGILKRLDDDCRHRINRAETNMFIFAIGINDTREIEGHDFVTIEKFQKNITDIITHAKKYTNGIVFIGLTPVDEAKVTNIMSQSMNKIRSYINEKIIRFDNVIEKICKTNSVGYIKMFDVLTTADLPDGLHPNPAGHEKMFKRIVQNLSLHLS